MNSFQKLFDNILVVRCISSITVILISFCLYHFMNHFVEKQKRKRQNCTDCR